jgi:hypothetical protein
MEKTKDRATRTPQKRDVNAGAPEWSIGACVTVKTPIIILYGSRVGGHQYT